MDGREVVLGCQAVQQDCLPGLEETVGQPRSARAAPPRRPANGDWADQSTAVGCAGPGSLFSIPSCEFKGRFRREHCLPRIHHLGGEDQRPDHPPVPHERSNCRCEPFRRRAKSRLVGMLSTSDRGLRIASALNGASQRQWDSGLPLSRACAWPHRKHQLREHWRIHPKLELVDFGRSTPLPLAGHCGML